MRVLVPWRACALEKAQVLVGEWERQIIAEVDRRARQAALIRSCCPWEHSTGPRTPEATARVAGNAYKGGTRLLLRKLRRALAEQRRPLARPKG
jgi:hypothetical protein